MNNKQLIILLCFLISCVGLFLRIEHRHQTDLWGDEIGHILSSSDSIPRLIRYSRDIVQFPGDPFLIYITTRLSENKQYNTQRLENGTTDKYILAIPRLIITAFGFYLLYLLGKQYFKTIWGYLILFLIFASNHELIKHALEIRPYGMIPIFSIASLIIMPKIISQKTFSLKEQILFSLFIGTTLLFHLYCSFILLFPYIFHLLFSRNKESISQVLVRHLKLFWPILTITLPIWYYFAFGFDRNRVSNTFPSTFMYIGKDPISFSKGVFGSLIGFKLFYIFLPGILFPFLFRIQDRLSQIAFPIITIALPLTALLLSCIKYNYWFIPRLFTWAMPLFAFQLAWHWDSFIYYFLNKSLNKNKTC